MADAISIQELIDARTDAKTLEEAVNGDAVTTVLSRLGETYPTLSNALNQIDSKLDSADAQIKQGITNLFENGGLPATPFTTKALMVASELDDGSYAVVTNDSIGSIGFYLKESGVWELTELGKSLKPSVADLSMHEGAAKFARFSIVDEMGKSALDIQLDGTTHIANLRADSISGEFEGNLGKVSKAIDVKDKPSMLSVEDVNGSQALVVDSDGVTHIAKLSVDSLPSIEQPYKSNKTPDIKSEIIPLISYGQSLSHGSSSGGAESTSPEFNNLMLDLGIIYSYYESGNVSSSNLVPAYENMDETPLTALSRTLHKELSSDYGISYEDYNYKFFLSATGRGAAKLSELDKGGSYYSRNFNVLSRLHELSQERGETMSLSAWFWSHGETDNSQGTPKEEYKSLFTTLLNDFAEDTKATTGQEYNPICIGYQVRPSSTAPSLEMPVAQYELSNELSDYVIACPLYQLQQPLHPAAWGYKVIGAYYALAYKRLLVDGVDWKPMQPRDVSYQNNLVIIDFHVPYGSLEIDTSNLPMYNNLGFNLRKENGDVIGITKVSRISPSKIKIEATENLTAGCYLTYGEERGGNIRDGQGYIKRINTGLMEFELHNWCLMFKHTF